MPRKPSEIRAEMEGLLEERLVENAAGKLVGGLLPTDPERWEELQAEINETINRVGRKLKAIRDPVREAAYPFRVQAARARASGDISGERAALAKVEEAAGWFMDWRNWLYEIDEDQREAEVDALYGAPKTERKAVALERMPAEERERLRQARMEGSDG